MNIIDILNKIKQNQSLSADEDKALATFVGLVNNPNKVPEQGAEEFATAQELSSQMQESLTDYLKSDSYKDSVKQLKKELRAKKATKAASDFLNLGLGLSDLATSDRQIKMSERGIRNLSRPNIPIPTGADPSLTQALTQAEQDIATSGARAIGPAQLQILDQYLKDIGTAKTASTGQASQFGSLAQLASLRRNRAAQGLIPIADQARQSAIRNRNDLLRTKQFERQNNFNNQIATANLLENRFNADASAVGNLGAAGRTNRRTSLENLAGALPGIIGGASGVFGIGGEADTPVGASGRPVFNYGGDSFEVYDFNPNRTLGFGPEIDTYADRINRDLFSRFSNPTIDLKF
jgi:hypothetical protein